MPGGLGTATSLVRPINQETLGMDGPSNLILQTIPSIGVISTATFRPGDIRNKPQFTSAPGNTGRLGIFAAGTAPDERAVILLLPKSGRPDRLMICITQTFGQGRAAINDLGKLGWSNPLSAPFIKFALLKHVINRWGAQVLASKKQMALLYILRAGRATQLGPFAHDGNFVVQVLTELAALTDGAFSFDHVEAFTFSSGISDFKTFLASVAGSLNVEVLYTIDPNPAVKPSAPKAAANLGFLSGQTFTGSVPPGFEYMPPDRWANEFRFPSRFTFDAPAIFNYMHNWVMPMYTLNLGIQIS